jgi:anti-sigma B factor antagonist
VLQTHIVTEQADSPADLLRVRSEKCGDAVVVHVVGELDLVSAPVLDELLIEAEAGSVAAPLVLDLTGVTFMASAGLALLMKHDERCGAAGRALRVVANGSAVLRPIALTGLRTVVTVMGTLADALEEK